eukprot:4901581-Pleurochrysis_carterae.AAC.1
MAANSSPGASGTPSLSWRWSADAASSSSSHSALERPSGRSASQLSALRHSQRPAPPLGAFAIAKPPRRGRFSSGATCE